MKTILLSFLCLVCISKGKSQSASPEHTVPATDCRLIYSEDLEAMISKDASAFGCKDIVVESLPPLTHTYTTFAIDFVEKGNYTFVKDKALELPADYKVYFEDNLTGQVFDLIGMDAFTFKVNRSIPKRFVLRIEKQTKLYAKSSSGGK
jgi:hypothetical protein